MTDTTKPTTQIPYATGVHEVACPQCGHNNRVHVSGVKHSGTRGSYREYRFNTCRKCTYSVSGIIRGIAW